MVVIDLERLFALPQHAGDLSVGHPVIVAEVEDQPLLERQLHRAEAPLPDIEQMLATTPTETLQQAAAENYDDILYNQQL